MPEDIDETIDEVEQSDTELLNDADVEIPEEIPEETEDKPDGEDTDEKEEEKKLAADEDKPFPHELPSFYEIKKEFPEFFKKFPVFRDMVFQSVEYRKMFPTVEDAREAVDDVIAFNGLRDSVLAGKTEDLLNAVEAADKAALTKMSTTFLPTLYKKNQELYVQAVTPIFENLSRAMFRSDNENTRNAATVLAHFMWGKDGESILKGEKTFVRNVEESDDEKRLKKEREDFETSKYNEFRGTCMSEMTSGMTRIITKGLDPDGTMSDYAKKTLITDIIAQVDKALTADASHMSVMNSRWLRTKREGYNLASKEKIVSAYLSRAKQVIPSIRDKARDDFFGNKRKSSESKLKKIDEVSSRKELVSGKSAPNGTGKQILKPDRALYRKMSDLDI